MKDRTIFSLRTKTELIPLLLILFIYSLSYLPRINQFGFYKDDWHMIYHGHTYGANTITDSFLIDRPIMGQINRAAYLLLGDSPLAWNLFAFIARFAGVLALYALLRWVWPERRYPAFLVTLLFAVYPGFLQQPNAATFQNHFIGYSLALISIALTIAALRSRGWPRLLAVAGSLVCTAGYLWIYEYMLGLEVMRLALAAAFLHERGITGWKTNARRLLLTYLPNLAVVLAFLGWRFFIFSSDRPATNVELIAGKYLAAPIQSLAALVFGGIVDFVETVWMAWSAPLYVVWQKAGPGVLALAFLQAALAFAAVLWFARRLERQTEQQMEPAAGPAPRRWGMAALGIGALTVAGALFPIIAAGRSVYFTDQFDRYTLHASAGVSLLAAGLLFAFFDHRLRTVILALMVGAAVMTHSVNGAYWAEFWKIQKDFWWQTAWRAPGLQDGAILMARLPQGYGLAEDYEIFSPANLVYHPEEPVLRIYGEILNSSTAQNVVTRNSYSYRYIRFFELKRDFRKTLIVDWPGAPACAHFIDGAQPEISAGSDALIYWTAPFSRADLILTAGPAPSLLPAIFGREPDPSQNWCYTYQKASLARQRSDWQEVIRLYAQAEANGLAAADPIEWIPFYQAFTAVGDQVQAERLAALIRADYATYASFCLVSQPEGLNSAASPFQMLCAPLDPQEQEQE